MDTVTHGIAGALIGNGYFADRHGRVATWALTIGSIFPDCDVVGELVSRDPMSLLKFHRGITHSFVALPFFAAGLAGLTRWYARRRGFPCPSWPVLFLIYVIGIGSHILLDVLTSFGTRIWDPISWTRVSWDWIFIVDFLFTAILLLPQVAAWVFRAREGSVKRAVAMWALFSLSCGAVFGLARLIGAPFASWVIVAFSLLLAALFFLPAARDWGFGVARSSWCRAGCWLAVAYLLACGAAHHAALNRVEAFAASQGQSVETAAAVPVPPSLLDWSGLVRTDEGVYEAGFSLSDTGRPEFQFVADSAPNRYISKAFELPPVKSYLGFARFPVVRYHQDGEENIVELRDVRFYSRRRRRPQPFTYRVVLDPNGKVIRQGWARE